MVYLNRPGPARTSRCTAYILSLFPAPEVHLISSGSAADLKYIDL